MSFIISLIFFKINTFACIDLTGKYSCLETPYDYYYDQKIETSKTNQDQYAYKIQNLLITNTTHVIADEQIHRLNDDSIFKNRSYMASCSNESLKFQIKAEMYDGSDKKLGDLTSNYKLYFNEQNEMIMEYDDVFTSVSGSPDSQRTKSICTRN